MEQNHEHKDHVGLQVLSWAVMIAMTLVAFFAVGMEWMAPSVVVPFILILAVIQVFLQVYIFMHLNNRSFLYPAVFLVSGLLIGFVIAIGIWDLIWLK